jgi:DNA replication and repair protein RecF
LTSTLVFERVAIRSLRNLTAVEIEPSTRLNVVSGDNGQGKTSLLEALYLVATSKSFRAEKLRELVQQGAESAVVRASLREAGDLREQRAALSERGRSFLVDGKRPPTLGSYATRTPVVVFHPGDLALVSGAAAMRRTLLDRVGLFIDPLSADDRQRYLHALRERQHVLEERGPAAAELDAFEPIAAQHGARWAAAHAASAERLAQALQRAFERLAPAELRLDVRFEPAGTDDPERFLAELVARRNRDRSRGSASFGPQRDELGLDVDGRSARRHASQGQQRILTLSLKLAELECVRQARGAHPVLLLDDVSSELDPLRTGAVYEFLRATDSQVFVTTTRRELFPTPDLGAAERRDFVLRDGVVRVLD